MNDLNTQQIVLLCLLVSFVSSVATGITTVSLLDQAPEPVSQTINRVVERTIEKVVDPVVETVTNVGGGTRTERVVETVIVNQEDLTVEAVEKNSKSLVRIYNADRNGVKTFVGLGVVISDDGKILTSSTVIESQNNLVADYPDGSNYSVSLSKAPQRGSILLEPSGVEDGKTFVPAVFGDSQNIKLAQSIISLGGQNRNSVSTGIVTSLESSTGVISESEVTAGSQPSTDIIQIGTSISNDAITRGAILMTLKGEIIGVRIAGSNPGSFISSKIIKSSMGI